jgi:hypothetical protein
MNGTTHTNTWSNWKAIGFILLLAFVSPGVFAQKFVAQVNKNKLAVGEVFQVSFTINTSGSAFKAPSFADFDVFSGPNQSTSMQINNGSVSQTLTLSYVLAPKKEGKFTIGPASIMVNGTRLESNSIPIEVKGSNPQQGSNPSGSQSPTNTSGQYASGKTDDDLFVRTFVSKKSCYLGEQIVVTQKVYSRLNLRGFQNPKMPVFNGFWSQNEDSKNKQIPLQQENLDGIQYNVAEYTKSYLFPQRSGQLTIDPLEVDCIVRQRSNRQPSSFIEQMMGMGYEDVLIKAKSKPIVIDVKPLPEVGKPANFNGAVGNFNMKAEVSKEKVKANESINLKLTISGRGNLKLTDAPKLNFPEGFESFDPKLSESYSEGGSISGTKTYDFLLIPRRAGEFTISGLGFSYFDPDKKSYIDVPAAEFHISVAPDPNGENSATVLSPSKTTVEEKENDIRYIKTGSLQLKPTGDLFFSSWKHYSLCGLSILAFAGFIAVSRNIEKRNSNIVAVKERKAAKLARKQLAAAERYKNQNNKDGFYQEVSIALNRYISDKLNIPVSELNRENIKTQLQKRNVSEATIQKLEDTLSSCEVARYAPSAVSADINTVYNNTIELIENIENEAKA